MGEPIFFIKEDMPMQQQVSVAAGYTLPHLSEVYNGRPRPTGWGRPPFFYFFFTPYIKVG